MGLENLLTSGSAHGSLCPLKSGFYDDALMELGRHYMNRSLFVLCSKK